MSNDDKITRRGLMTRLLAGASFVVLGGCQKAGGDRTKVSGKVTLDGAPLEEGTIMFVSADKKTEPATGDIKNGQYSLPVPPGPKIVQISAKKVIGKKKLYEGEPNSPEVDQTQELIPARYNEKSELKADISTGSQELKPFELKSK